IRYKLVTGVQTCALPIYPSRAQASSGPAPASSDPPAASREPPADPGGSTALREGSGFGLKVDPLTAGQRAILALSTQERSPGQRSEERRVGKGWRARW